jgi:hypothetical protein
MSLCIITAAQAGSEFAGLCARTEFAAIDREAFTNAFGRRYYPLALGDRRSDRSFAVIDGEAPSLIMLCSAGEGNLDWYGMPARVLAPSGQDFDVAATGALMAHVDTLIDGERIHTAVLADGRFAPTLGPLGGSCLSRGWRASLTLHGQVDLTTGEPGLRKALRKSFRSLVNWGRRNLSLAYVNRENPGRQAFEDYRAFHLQVAGRSTRPDASWDAMFDSIAAGGGELALGRLETGELVAGTMVLDGTEVAYYGSGVYDRERFDKPMAHFPLYDAILRAGDRGKAVFDLGEIPQAGTASPKEQAIGYFKRGFASEIATRLVWTFTRSPDSGEDEA